MLSIMKGLTSLPCLAICDCCRLYSCCVSVLIDNDSNPVLMIDIQDVVHQSRLPRAKKACSSIVNNWEWVPYQLLAQCRRLAVCVTPVINVTGTDLKAPDASL